MMEGKCKRAAVAAAVFAATAAIGFAASSCAEKKDVSQKSSEAQTVTNDNGSVSRSFTECTVSTNGGMVTEHRRETRTTLDQEGNVLATTTSEYAQTYPVGEESLSSLAAGGGADPGASAAAAAKPAEPCDSFMGLKFGAEFQSTNFVSDAEEPTLLRAEFVPAKPLEGFEGYWVYVTPETHRVAKVYACAREAADPGAGWRRNYLIEALERRYRTWGRLRSWRRPVYTFDVGGGRHVTACLAGASRDWETVLAAWDDAVLADAEAEAEAVRRSARKAAAEKRRKRISAAEAAF